MCNTGYSDLAVSDHIGTELVKLSIAEMIKGQCEEVVLEAEVTNSGALTLYQNLGFIRDKRLHRYLPPLQCHEPLCSWKCRSL